MNSKKFFVVILLVLLIVTNFKVLRTSAEAGEDYLGNALKNTNSTIEEIGLNASYKINSDGKKECKVWLKNMNFGNKSTEVDSEKKYFVDFSDKNMSGYIESVKENNYYDISIYVKELTDKNNIIKLKRKVTKAINYKSTCYTYIKAKSKMKDINQIAYKMQAYFVKNGAENLRNTKIKNILSTTMYTGKYDYVFDDTKKVDLNYAVCKYNDGNYIIMGTPILNINY